MTVNINIKTGTRSFSQDLSISLSMRACSLLCHTNLLTFSTIIGTGSNGLLQFFDVCQSASLSECTGHDKSGAEHMGLCYMLVVYTQHVRQASM